MINKFGFPVKDYGRQYTSYKQPKYGFFEAIKTYFAGNINLDVRSKKSIGRSKKRTRPAIYLKNAGSEFNNYKFY